MRELMIVFEGVTKKYGKKTAVSDLSFQVEKGEFFGFLGPNGAGKTTSIKSMIGLIRTDAGKILIDGIDISLDPYTARSRIGYVPDSPFIYEKLTGKEFLKFVGGLYSMDSKTTQSKINWLTEIFEMGEWINYKSEEYSHGMKQKIIMSAAFIHDPKLLIVDEPTVGLDPPSKRLLKDLLKLMCGNGTTVFMSSHDLFEVEELCHRMVILHEGVISAMGTIDDLRNKAQMEGGNFEDLFLKLTGRISKKAFLE